MKPRNSGETLVWVSPTVCKVYPKFRTFHHISIASEGANAAYFYMGIMIVQRRMCGGDEKKLKLLRAGVGRSRLNC